MSKLLASGNVSDNNDVYVTPGWKYANLHNYQVWVNGVMFDEFNSRDKWLSQSEMFDIAAGYKEAIDDAGRAVVESETHQRKE